MGQYKIVVLSNAVAGREEEYNDWYTNQHLSDVLAIPGVKLASRLIKRHDLGAGTPQFCAIYDVETDDPGHVAGELTGRAGTESMVMSDAITDITAAVYEEFARRDA